MINFDRRKLLGTTGRCGAKTPAITPDKFAAEGQEFMIDIGCSAGSRSGAK